MPYVRKLLQPNFNYDPTIKMINFTISCYPINISWTSR